MSLNFKLLRTFGISHNIVNKTRFLRIIAPNLNHVSKLSTEVPPTTQEKSVEARYDNISKAMQAYLERSKDHESFLKIKKEEFEMGKRHLANIMNIDVDDLTQEKIDESIKYLLPSGLFQPKARPMMKPPEEIYPKRKDAEFDASGRPFHSFFFCTKPNFYQILFEATGKLHDLNTLEDSRILKGQLQPPPPLDLQDSEWVNVRQLTEITLEPILEDEYEKFTGTMDKLASHPYGSEIKEYIMDYRVLKSVAMKAINIRKLKYDAEGRPFVMTPGKRKQTRCTLVLKGQGSGKVSINGRDITILSSLAARKQIMYPLQFTGLLGKMDIEISVKDATEESLAGAARLALSRALCSFVDKDVMEDMRLAGLLTPDPRNVERQKPGQKGARAKYKWLKR